MILGGKETVLDSKFPHCNLKNLEVSYFLHHRRRVTFTPTISRLVSMAHVFYFPAFSIRSVNRRARASALKTRFGPCRCRMGTRAKDPPAGSARCNIVRVGHPD